MTNRTRRPLKTLLAHSSGASASEFALVVPLILAFLFGTIEFGRFMWTRNSLQTAVESAARCAALDTPQCNTVALTQAYAVNAAMGVNVVASAFTVATEACGSAVTATYQFTSITPLIPLNATINTRACRGFN